MRVRSLSCRPPPNKRPADALQRSLDVAVPNEIPHLCRETGVSIAIQSSDELEELPNRLRKMSDDELMRFGKAARSLCRDPNVLTCSSVSWKRQNGSAGVQRRSDRLLEPNWTLFSGQRWRFSICSFNFRQELKPCSCAIMNRASSSAGLDTSVEGSTARHRLSALGSRRCNPRSSCLASSFT